MPLMFIFVVGIGVALIRRRLVVTSEGPTGGGDAPARLVGWAVGLLDASRAEWGQAMIGELDRLDGRARRWRFALDCVAAAVILPPWGRAAAVLGVLMSVAAAAGGLAVYTHVHYRLGTDGWTWVWVAVLTALLVGYVLGGSALLRRPGVAGPGLVGGLFVIAAWLADGGFTFTQWLTSIRSGAWWLLLFVVPIMVGAGSTLWSGSAVIGRRAARLAGTCAALVVYLYGVLAVAVIGATGDPLENGWTTADAVADRLVNQAVFYLLALPLMTTTIGWAAAAATARLRHLPSTVAAPALLTASGPDPAPIGTHSSTTAPEAHPGVSAGATIALAGRRNRTWYLLVLCAAAVAAAFLVFLTFLPPHQR